MWASGRHVLVQWGTVTPLRPLCTWTADFLIFNLGSLQKKEGLHPSGAGEEKHSRLQGTCLTFKSIQVSVHVGDLGSPSFQYSADLPSQSSSPEVF